MIAILSLCIRNVYTSENNIVHLVRIFSISIKISLAMARGLARLLSKNYAMKFIKGHLQSLQHVATFLPIEM